MKQQFLNAPDDVQWLKETHLKGVQGVPEFASFVIVGNEDSPDELRLYASNDPHYRDTFTRVSFSGDCDVAPTVTHGVQS